jgi:hypothetical protein
MGGRCLGVVGFLSFSSEGNAMSNAKKGSANRNVSSANQSSQSVGNQPVKASSANAKAPQANVEEVRKLAYQIWDQKGRPHGESMSHWLAAEKQLGLK